MTFLFQEHLSRGPVPRGFDFAYYNAAPRDQQIDLLRHSASLVLENLHREHARFVAKLPHVRPRSFLVSPDGERSLEIALRCDTLWIDTDRALLTLSWRGLVGLGTAEAEDLETLVVAAESKGKELRWKHIQRMLREGTSVSLDEDLAGESHPLSLRHDSVRAAPGPSITPSAVSALRPSAPPPALADAARGSNAASGEHRLMLGRGVRLTSRPPPADLPSSASLVWDAANEELSDLEATTTIGPREATPAERGGAAAPEAGDGPISERTRPFIPR